MSYFRKNEGVRKIMLQWLQQMKCSYAKKISELDTALKCDQVSLLWRQMGNDKFRANLVEESYCCYSKSVLYANHNGPMYPLALANRSASLLRMKRFKESLADVALAIESGYPAEQRHKLLLRRVDCHIELGQRSEARSALSSAIEHAKALNLSAIQTLEFEKHVKILEKKLDNPVCEINQDDEFQLPECHEGSNTDFVSASGAIELRRSETAGRHVVAKASARRGDVLFSEEPYAWVTLPAEEPACEMCCQTDINLVPCSRCSRSVYCGAQCRASASPAFHRWECAGAQFALFPTIGIAHLALRVLLLSANEGFPRIPRAFPEPKSAAELFQGYAKVDNIHIYKQDTPPFYRMFNLVTNFDKMNNNDYIQYALTATMLINYLEHFTTFFDYLPSKVPYRLSGGQLRLFAGALILRSLGQLVCNGHAALSLCTVEEDDGLSGRTITEREVRKATAIYPSAAMMNHSCDPNIINTFYKKRLIVRCASGLPAGAEVLNCYGPHRAREPAPRRQAQLRAQYMFTCACTACRDAERRDFALLFSAYVCQSCKSPVVLSGQRAQCRNCSAALQLDRALSIIDRAEDLALQGEQASSAEERCEKMYTAYRLKQQVWHRHHTSLRAAADRLARLHADLGDYSKSVELIKQNVQSLEYQFGSFSVEVAHELRKLSDVMLERIFKMPGHPDYRDWCLEAHKVIKKAVQLMELNYGHWEVLVKRLREQEAFVASLLAESRTPETADCVQPQFALQPEDMSVLQTGPVTWGPVVYTSKLGTRSFSIIRNLYRK
ncbi:unnamed protein product, partial [Iphiclides podalirius]